MIAQMTAQTRKEGKRSGQIRLHSAPPKSRQFYQESLALLRRHTAAYEEMTQQTLEQVLARAKAAPYYREHRQALDEIRSLEDLQCGFYTSSKKIAGLDADTVGWDALITDECALFLAGTSGTSGSSKYIPYSQRSFDHNIVSSAPYIAHMTLRHSTAHQPTVLALSAPDRFITWHIMPKLFAGMGYNVVHVTLSDYLQDDGLAQDLVDYLLTRDVCIDAIVCFGSMLPHFLTRLTGFAGGAAAVARLAEQVNYVVSGGTEMSAELEATLRDTLQLTEHSISNFFASTEAGVMAGSTHACSDLYPSLQFQTPVLIPLAELERESAEPGYRPKGVLLTRAPIGTVGELAVTVNQMIPWINFRTGDLFEVTGLCGDYLTVPRLRTRADLSNQHDLGGAKVKPHEYKEIMESIAVTDYLAMSLKANEVARSTEANAKDRLVFFYEGGATVDEIADSLLAKQQNISVAVKEVRTLDMLIVHVREGALARYRVQRSIACQGAPGPLKHKVVKGAQYAASDSDIIEQKIFATETQR